MNYFFESASLIEKDISSSLEKSEWDTFNLVKELTSRYIVIDHEKDIEVFQRCYSNALNAYLLSGNGSDEQIEKAKNILSTIQTKTDNIALYRDALPKRNMDGRIIKSTAEKFKLLITLSADEVQVITRLYHSRSEEDFRELIVELSKIEAPTTGESYVLGALIQMRNLWKSRMLDNANAHGEDWYRINVLSMVWDAAFLYEKEYVPKRSECKPLHQKGSEAFNRVDFIYRAAANCDLLIGEEKRPSASKTSQAIDTKTCEQLRSALLDSWIANTDKYSEIAETHMEAISIEWHGLNATIRGTKRATNQKTNPVYLHYPKASLSIPVSHNATTYQDLAQCLASTISLRRQAIQTHKKLDYITECIKDKTASRTAMDEYLKKLDMSFLNDYSEFL
ncbi:hypothetical protein BJV82DRAFT_698970 [Fennellomyces sp. T-0311]|nr:hypothetical protein BJV82DRAFT_698970 [Fennellomyces sp. T-0311]